MSGSKTFYITTAISYVNGPPHLGHAYEAIATDVLARFKRLDGYDVMFLTGTDEHGQKVARTAEAAGKDPKVFCNEIAVLFQDMTELLNISNDDFIRTTEPRHYESSQAIWRKLEAAGEIYLDTYGGWYSVRDEAYFGEEELTKGEGGKFFAPSGAEAEWVEEPSYFFRLSQWQDRLLKHYADNATNRVILLTDGITNRGVTDPDQIAKGSLVYNDRGIDLSTIGVGQDLNHDLLSTLASSGRGLFHFVADSKDIEKVFDKEIQSLLSPVATKPKIEISFPTSVLVEKVYGYDAIIHGNKVTVELDNMNNGMTEVVLVKFRPVVEREFGAGISIRLTYYDIE
ncbi:MAG: class I tRNA ligase family protein, partial [Proteobacteria bacterium]|nr:class I tRNA ligase family protein [Pseudomonadota bacterium]